MPPDALNISCLPPPDMTLFRPTTAPCDTAFHLNSLITCWLDVLTSLSVCPLHISETTLPNFTKSCACCPGGCSSILLWRRCDTFVLPVLWTTSCFHTTGPMVRPQRYSRNYCNDSNHIQLHDRDRPVHIVQVGRGQGRSDGGISVYTPPKKKKISLPYNFYVVTGCSLLAVLFTCGTLTCFDFEIGMTS